MSLAPDEELELDGAEPDGAAAPPEEDEDDAPEGLDGVVAPPPLADEDDGLDGEVVAPEGEVVDEDEELRSAPRSHEASSAAPNAMETATAMVESLMWPPWLGY